MTVEAGGVDRPEVALVEDERNVRELYLDVLDAKGFHVVPLESVAAAEAYLARHAPDLVLLDVKLGDGDGLVLLDKLPLAITNPATPPPRPLGGAKWWMKC